MIRGYYIPHTNIWIAQHIKVLVSIQGGGGESPTPNEKNRMRKALKVVIQHSKYPAAQDRQAGTLSDPDKDIVGLRQTFESSEFDLMLVQCWSSVWHWTNIDSTSIAEWVLDYAWPASQTLDRHCINVAWISCVGWASDAESQRHKRWLGIGWTSSADWALHDIDPASQTLDQHHTSIGSTSNANWAFDYIGLALQTLKQQCINVGWTSCVGWASFSERQRHKRWLNIGWTSSADWALNYVGSADLGPTLL